MTHRPISPNQHKFIMGLLTERLGSLGCSLTEAAANLNLDRLDIRDASTLIERLKALPKDADPDIPEVVAKSTRYGKYNRPGRCASCGHVVGQDEGYYFLAADGRWGVHHKAGECSTEPVPTASQVTLEPGLYEYNGQIILVYKTRNDRLAGKVKQGRSFRYQQGAVALAGLGNPVTAAYAAAYGHQYDHCCACGRDLEDDRSTQAGYGPVCAKKYGWPWGMVTA